MKRPMAILRAHPHVIPGHGKGSPARRVPAIEDLRFGAVPMCNVPACVQADISQGHRGVRRGTIYRLVNRWRALQGWCTRRRFPAIGDTIANSFCTTPLEGTFFKLLAEQVDRQALSPWS